MFPNEVDPSKLPGETLSGLLTFRHVPCPTSPAPMPLTASGLTSQYREFIVLVKKSVETNRESDFMVASAKGTALYKSCKQGVSPDIVSSMDAEIASILTTIVTYTHDMLQSVEAEEDRVAGKLMMMKVLNIL